MEQRCAFTKSRELTFVSQNQKYQGEMNFTRRLIVYPYRIQVPYISTEKVASTGVGEQMNV